MKPRLRKWAFSGLFFMLLILVVELALQLLCRTNTEFKTWLAPRYAPSNVTTRVGHAVLLNRPNPEFSGHDFRGFRNIGYYDQYDVVALGDSQTYAMGSPMAAAWPQQLEFISGAGVYNMGWGGWEPVAYTRLVNEALKLNPKTILATFYTADVQGSYRSVYHRNLALAYKTNHVETLNELVEWELIPPLKQRLKKAFTNDLRLRKNLNSGQKVWQEITPYTPHPLPNPDFQAAVKITRLLPALHQSLIEHWRPYYRLHYRVTKSLPEIIPDTLNGKSTKDLRLPDVVDQEMPDYLLHKVPNPLSIFLIHKRAYHVDFTDPATTEGFRITVAAFTDLHRQLNAKNIQFKVVMIPTKENVLYDLMEKTYDTLPASYIQFVRRERLLRGLLKHRLAERGIPFIDPLPELKACLDRNELPYPLSRDGHPIPVGYHAIAQAVNKQLYKGTQLPPQLNELRKLADEAYPKMNAAKSDTTGMDGIHAVRVRLIRASTPPTVASIRPYSNGLVTHGYELIESPHEADWPSPILITHWAVKDGTDLNRTWTVGQEYAYTIDPMTNHTDILDEPFVDETDLFDAPAFFELSK